MKLKTNSICICLLLLLHTYLYAQIEQYNYKREITGIADQWHRIILPDNVYKNTTKSLDDIRIIGITKNNDTIEAPYILTEKKEEVYSNEINFSIVNISHNEKGHYFTFEIPKEASVNQINLNFKNQNFDWRLKLEGSQTQQEWFTIVEDYRILSIINELTNFQFTKVIFPDTKHKFYRVFIVGNEKPELLSAIISIDTIKYGTYNTYPIQKPKIGYDKLKRLTEIDISLTEPAFVNIINIESNETFDYYRPISIKYISDSIKTEKGWHYDYATLKSGTLNSLEKNEFTFSGTTLSKLKILIDNGNNDPLTFNKIEVKGFTHELIIRFTKPANYYLVYGNTKAKKPMYDIELFKNKIPENLVALSLGNEQIIEKKVLPKSVPLFGDKKWLWAIMVLIMLLLGWFSLKMLREK